MAAARVTGMQPETLIGQSKGDIVRWVQAAIDGDEMLGEWFPSEALSGD